MARDLELWLEASPGCVVPPECFAALRPGDAKVPPAPPTRCVPHEASRIGSLGLGGGPAVVDIFHKVGSISIGLLQHGETGEAAVGWPGIPDLRLRVAVVLASAQGELSPAQEGELPLPAAAVVPISAPQAAAVPPQALPPQQQPPAEAPEPRKEQSLLPLQAASVAAEVPAQLRRASTAIGSALGEEDPAKLYKPIALNNADQIIPNLYLGGVAAVGDQQALVQQGIRAICCCCRELEFPTSEFCKEVEYYRVDVEDISREPVELYFPEATEFIHSWLSREQPVLVHCRAGVSRSASVVIAYLITYQGYSLHDAFFLVRSHRSVVTPNIGFMEKLGEYEEAKRGTQPTIDINKYLAWYTTPERAAVPDLKPD